MRKKIFDMVEAQTGNNKVSLVYDIFMMVTIVVSIFPLAFKETNTVFYYIDRVTVVIFIIDYILRLFTADYKLNKAAISFVLFPFTPMAIIDLVVIPSK